MLMSGPPGMLLLASLAQRLRKAGGAWLPHLAPALLRRHTAG